MSTSKGDNNTMSSLSSSSSPTTPKSPSTFRQTSAPEMLTPKLEFPVLSNRNSSSATLKPSYQVRPPLSAASLTASSPLHTPTPCPLNNIPCSLHLATLRLHLWNVVYILIGTCFRLKYPLWRQRPDQFQQCSSQLRCWSSCLWTFHLLLAQSEEFKCQVKMYVGRKT